MKYLIKLHKLANKTADKLRYISNNTCLLPNQEFTYYRDLNGNPSVLEINEKNSLDFKQNLGNGVVLEMVHVPKGDYIDYRSNQVFIDDDFWISKYPITNTQIYEVLRSRFTLFNDKPIVNINWDECYECSFLHVRLQYII
jgi:hypothetical protein